MRARSLLFTLVLMLPACGSGGRDADAVRQTYQSYQVAMVSGDLARLQMLLARDRVPELSAPNAAAMLEMASAMYPAGAQIAGVQLNGSEATLQLTGRMQDGSATGSVRLVKEDGAWKVSKEDWSIQITADASAGPASVAQLPPDAVRPADYATLLGTWKGGDRGTTDWTITFGENYEVTGEHASGAYYRGQAAIFFDLGATAAGIRVPPGWGLLDVHVAEASEPRHVGQVSLGTFSRQGDTLKFCGSEPGTSVRTESFEAPPSGIRCLTLVRAGDVVAAATTPPSPASVVPPPPLIRREKDGARGHAQVLLDGTASDYPLYTGFVSDTRFADPRRATIQFRPESGGHSSGLRLTLDATATGRHYADGKSINDMMFNGGKVEIGRDEGRGRAAILQWVADGGQVFPPKQGCTIDVISPYTGRTDGVFEGTISGCTLHSAGIDRQLTSVRFAMYGASSR